MAQPEIRGSLPQRLCDSGRSQSRHWCLARLLQRGAPAHPHYLIIPAFRFSKHALKDHFRYMLMPGCIYVISKILVIISSNNMREGPKKASIKIYETNPAYSGY